MKRRRSSARRRKIRRQRRVAGGVILALLFFAFLGVTLIVRKQVTKVPEDVIWNHIYIDEVDVSGMNAVQAKDALEQELQKYGVTTLRLSVEEVQENVTLNQLGFYAEDVDHLIEQAVAYGKEGGIWQRYRQLRALEKEKKVIPVRYAVKEQTITSTIAQEIPHLENEAKDATISRKNGAFVIQDEVKGVMVDVKASAQRITEFLNGEWKKDGGEITLVTKEGEPKVTRADLETIKDRLGTFTTYCGYGGGRVQNIVTGVKHINGTVLMPGEEYSANAAMEPYTKENGYEEAGSYENGAVVQSMGGGICQVSSTLYNAIILSEVEIVERAAHSMLVGYVKPSMDAAIAGDFKDLKFKNNQDTPIFIEGYVSGGNVTFNIYGKETRPANREIKFENEIVSKTEAKKKFEASKDKIGTFVKVSSGYDGMKAKLWKIVYEGGKEVSRKVVNNSTYRTSEAIYHVGTSSDVPEATELVKAAIKTQNETKIKNAIKEAKKLIEEKKAEAQKPSEETAP